MNRSQPVNVQSFLNEQPFSGYQWLIFALCFLIVLLDGFDTAAIGFVAPSLIKEWGIGRPALAPVLRSQSWLPSCAASVPNLKRYGRTTTWSRTARG